MFIATLSFHMYIHIRLLDSLLWSTIDFTAGLPLFSLSSAGGYYFDACRVTITNKSWQLNSFVSICAATLHFSRQCKCMWLEAHFQYRRRWRERVGEDIVCEVLTTIMDEEKRVFFSSNWHDNLMQTQMDVTAFCRNESVHFIGDFVSLYRTVNPCISDFSSSRIFKFVSFPQFNW